MNFWKKSITYNYRWSVFFLLFSLALISIQKLSAQEPAFYSFNEQYGFDENVIYDYEYDQYGDFWIATSNGLYRYDGSIFHEYYHKGFPREYGRIKMDGSGRIFVQTFMGQILYVENDSLHLFGDYSDKMTHLFEYAVAKDGRVFIQAGRSIFIQDSPSDSLVKIKAVKGLSNDVRTLSLTPQEDLVFQYYTAFQDGTDKFYRVMILKGGEMVELGKIKFKGRPVWPLSKIYNGKLYFMHYSDVKTRIFEISDTLRMVYSIGERWTRGMIQDFYIDKNQRLFLSSKSGLFPFDEKGSPLSEHPWLDYKNVGEIMLDNDGVLYVATLNKGILIAPRIQVHVDKRTDVGLSMGVMDDNGGIYALDTRGRLHVDNRFFNASIKILDGFRSPGPISFDPFNQKISGAAPNFFNYDIRTSSFYLGNQDGFKRRKYLKKGVSVITYSTSSILLVKKDNEAPESLRNKLDSFIWSPAKRYWYKTLRKKRCHALALDKGCENCFYIGYVDGLFYYENWTEGSRVLDDGKNIIAEYLFEENDEVWAGTQAGILYHMKNGIILSKYNIGEPIVRISKWNDEIIYSNNEGVTRYNLKTGKKEIINWLDGLIKEKVVDIFVVNDTLKIISENHFSYIPLKVKYENEKPPVFKMGSITVNGDLLPSKPAYDFPHHKNDIRIQFGALSFRSRGEHTFYYKMKGISEKWSQTTAYAPFASFHDLRPGQYEFQVKACNEDGICSEVHRLPITIRPPFYRTLWFYLLITILILGLFWWIVQQRLRVIGQRAELRHEKEVLEKELYRSKVAAFQTQMNPHFIFNALNTIQDFILRNDPDSASEYMADFADLIRSYLNQSEARSIALDDEIQMLSLYLKLEQVRFGDEMEYSIKTELSKYKDEYELPVMLIQPFVENSIKHGLFHKKGEKRLDILFYEENNYLICVITDNGVGREYTQKIQRNKGKHKSFATIAIDERVHLANQFSGKPIHIQTLDLKDDNSIPLGTRVIIKMLM